VSLNSFVSAAEERKEYGVGGTGAHSTKKKAELEHFEPDAKARAADPDFDLSGIKGHGAKSEDVMHFEQEKAAKEAALAGEKVAPSKHGLKEDSGATHYEP
ncbi:MAG: hypothetical protein HY586_05785, partial [Candidatus Omnitrophica bacterium]|nr:hypothetical protein [Candidatus Omnitrophota bacterium]